MTAHALLVLTLALVCSPSGTSPGQTNQASGHTKRTHGSTYAHTDEQAAAMLDTRTNIHNYIDGYLDNKHEINNRDIDYLGEKYLKKHIDNFYSIDQEKSRKLFDNKYRNIQVLDDINKEIVENSNFDTTHKKLNVSHRNEFDKLLAPSLQNKYDPVKFVDDKYKAISLSNDASIKKYHKTPITMSKKINNSFMDFINNMVSGLRVKRQDAIADKCEMFSYSERTDKIQHPHDLKGINKNYYSMVECDTYIEAPEHHVIKLTFVDVFHIEDHPKCLYDYLEIRDGKYGYAKSLGRFCGEAFPRQITSTGPFMWLKFKSDETIEYEGFTIKVEKIPNADSHKVPDECYMEAEIENGAGVIDSAVIDDDCKDKSEGHALDVLWTIETDPDTYIYLNFTSYVLAKPNECEENIVQVFGNDLEDEKKLAHYCGSVANSVTTKLSEGKQVEKGNIMRVHLYASQAASKMTKFSATFTAFKQLDPSTNDVCPEEYSFNCQDNTCIHSELSCDGYAHCRLKADEDPETCKGETEPIHKQFHIMIILVIFVLILSGMSFVFLFNCIRKLYQDHKIIKEHIRQSCEDRLDNILTDSRLMLDAKRLQRDSEPRASLERENHTNELFKQQRSISQHKQTSIESDFQETHLDIDEEPWRRDVDSVPEPKDHKVERNGKLKRDTSRKEDSIRNRKESTETKKEIKDAAVGAPDTKESGCQTRESLFQADTAPSSDGSNSANNSRGFSTFGYSGATLARPSPPAAAPADPAAPAAAPALTSTQIELLRQIPSQESKKKMSDRRPMSAETTRSAPDVIIVSKPIR